MALALDNEDLADVKALIEELGIVCPVSGTKNWTDVRQFNLMFGTKLGHLRIQRSTLFEAGNRTRDLCQFLSTCRKQVE